MLNLVLVWIGKIVSLFSRVTNLGNGSTWPGHIALEISPNILKNLEKRLPKGSIVIAGTNGKTTTSKLTRTVLEKKYKVIHNESGANLLNGLTSSLIKNCNLKGKPTADLAVFEVDENTLPLLVSSFTPKAVVILNLFRDQLDRYGEVDTVALKWRKSLEILPKTTTVFLNADDPQIAYLAKNLEAKVVYFGLEKPELFLEKFQHATDSTYCPKCTEKLDYEGVYYSHLGIWKCPGCELERPKVETLTINPPLPGVYNLYNTLAAQVVLKSLGFKEKEIADTFKNFKPAFGRQEEFTVSGKKIKILLSKNPTGFNETIRTLKEFSKEKKTVVLVLNDRIPDGRDISWIWDVDYEDLSSQVKEVVVSGDRAFDMALRIKYAEVTDSNKLFVFEKLSPALNFALSRVKSLETLYILPTYSAMLEVRKILRGRKIL